MVIGKKNVFGYAANFLRGKKHVFCGTFKINRTGCGCMRCRSCYKTKSLSRVRQEIAIPRDFYQLQPAYRLAADLGARCQSRQPCLSAPQRGTVSPD